jgi:hypothetical protein
VNKLIPHSRPRRRLGLIFAPNVWRIHLANPVAPLVIGNRRPSAVRMTKLFVGPALTSFNEPKLLQDRNDPGVRGCSDSRYQ